MITLERAALGSITVLCVGLGFWNVSLQSQLAELRATNAAAADLPPATAALDADPRRDRRADTPRRARRSGSEGARDWRPSSQRDGDGEAQAEGERPERGDRPERTEAEWAEMRAQMETATIDVIEAYAQQHAWEADTSEEVLALFLDGSEAIGEVWGRMHAGETSHFQARREMNELRDATGRDVAALVGEPAYEELEEHLWEARRELWRRD